MPPALAIHSRQHPFVRRCRAIGAGRGEPGEILLDGEHLIDEALAAGVQIEGVLTDGRLEGVLSRAARRGVPRYDASADVLAAASPVQTSTGVVALAKWTPEPAARLLEQNATLLVGLVGVQDPGNVGGIIRSADALGAGGVLALDGTSHPGSWKVLRGSMGSVFRLPIGVGRLDDVLEGAARHGIRVAAAVATGGTALDRANLEAPLLLLVGSEGSGLPASAEAASNLRLTIPMRDGVNSLNAAVSTALILWEFRRRGLSRGHDVETMR